jgi:hypothetical protein
MGWELIPKAVRTLVVSVAALWRHYTTSLTQIDVQATPREGDYAIRVLPSGGTALVAEHRPDEIMVIDVNITYRGSGETRLTSAGFILPNGQLIDATSELLPITLGKDETFALQAAAAPLADFARQAGYSGRLDLRAYVNAPWRPRYTRTFRSNIDDWAPPREGVTITPTASLSLGHQPWWQRLLPR